MDPSQCFYSTVISGRSSVLRELRVRFTVTLIIRFECLPSDPPCDHAAKPKTFVEAH